MTTTNAASACPFCGGPAKIDACDRLISIGCEACQYRRSFHGLLQTAESPVRVSDLEFYHQHAKADAITAWNMRAALSTAGAAAGQPGWDEDNLYTIERAADLLEGYVEFIEREVTSVDIEAHPYLPELEGVAKDLRALASQPSPGATVPTDLALCEAHRLVLRVGRLYRFGPVGDCETCARLAADAESAYGPPEAQTDAGHVCASPVAVVAEPTDADEDAYVIQQLGKLLAEIAVILKGPERPRHRHGYQDLPALVMGLAAFKQAVLDPENQPSQFGTTLLSSVAEPTGWQSIETAPKDGTLILLAAKHGVWMGKYQPVYGSGYVPKDPWSSMLLNHDHLTPKTCRATHWMPLPPAPKE